MSIIIVSQQDIFVIDRWYTDSLLSGKKLSLNSIVLRRMFFLWQTLSESTFTRELCFQLFFYELKPLWNRSYISMKPDKACIDQFEKLHTNWSTLKKIPLNRRSSVASLTQIKKFQAELNKLCDFSPPDIEKILSNSRRRSSS